MIAVWPWMRRSILNRQMAKALAIVSPGILASLSGIVVGLALDRRLTTLRAERETTASDMTHLEQFAHDFEAKELQRASFLLGLAAGSADQTMRYTLDRLYRVSAAGSLRRIAAQLYPDDWQQRLAAYETLIGSDYRDVAAVQNIQTSENDLLRDAHRTLTGQQARIDGLNQSIGHLEARKGAIQSVVNTLMYVLTVVAFFLQTAA